MIIKFLIKGLTNARPLQPFIQGKAEEDGWIYRTVSSGRLELDVVRMFVFGLARDLKAAGFHDFKVGDSPYFIGQTRLFWNWLANNWRRNVEVKARKEQPPEKSPEISQAQTPREPDVATGETRAESPLQEVIRKVDGQFQVQSHAGKNLGTYRSKAGAVKRLGQVEWFKSHPKSEGIALPHATPVHFPLESIRDEGWTNRVVGKGGKIYQGKGEHEQLAAKHGITGQYAIGEIRENGTIIWYDWSEVADNFKFATGLELKRLEAEYNNEYNQVKDTWKAADIEEADTRTSMQRVQDLSKTDYVPGNKRPKKLGAKVDDLWKSIWLKNVKDIEELEEIQKSEVKSSGYMAGLYNGLDVAKCCLTGEEAQLVENPDQRVRHFEDRTAEHIKRVQLAAEKIAKANPEFKEFDGTELMNQVATHDASKLEEPERTPYIDITWRHKLEQDNDEFNPIKGKGYQNPGNLKKDSENQATLRHITNNSHHPEFYNKEQANISKDNRDKSDHVLDASKMPALDIAEMVADWQAMAEELKKNTAREWYDKQKDVRWHFSEEQDNLIDRLLRVFEIKEN